MDGILFPYLKLVKTRRFAVISPSTDHEALLTKKKKLVMLDLNCEYTCGVVERALTRRALWCDIIDAHTVDTMNASDEDGDGILQVADFENIRWEMVLRGGSSHRASSYLVRKGLSRKAQLALQVKRFVAKHPSSELKEAFPETLIIETWDAFESVKVDFGMGAVADFSTSRGGCWHPGRITRVPDEGEDEDEDEGKNRNKKRNRWILKPSVTNKGMDISLCHDWDSFLDALEMTPDIREWVLQRYIERPLLVRGYKFHLRVYILCVGALKVYVFDQILMLLAAHQYAEGDGDDIYRHLSNTARAVEDVNFSERKFVKVFDDLPFYMQRECPHLMRGMDGPALLKTIRDKTHSITAELFRAFENEYTVFAPMPNCFEIFGLDFMVDEALNVSFLEANPGPDFKQTGGRLKGLINQLWEQTLTLVVDEQDSTPDFTLVYDQEASVSNLRGGMSLT
eukprot:GSChrysophyteH1.ASY1.ANO1.1260.1 assembled CDS